MKKYICLVLLFFMSCKEKVKDINEVVFKREVAVDYGVQAFSEIQTENQGIIKKFEECYNAKSFLAYDNYWDKNDTIFFNKPYENLYGILNRNYPSYTPTIVSVQRKNKEKYLVKIAIIGNPEGFFSLDYIYNIYAIKNKKKGFVFKNTISDNLKNWKTTNVGNISYYSPNNRLLNNKNIKKQIDFENYLTAFLNVEKINYKYVVCSSIREIYEVLGYDFVDTMFFTEQVGALSYPHQNILFSGNDSEFYPHELVHIYSHKKFPNIHPVFDEGFATYLGGSKGMEYKEHIMILRNHIKNERINIFDYLFDNRKRHVIIGDNTSFMYSFGAFICHLIVEKFGEEKLFQFMNCGKSDKELQTSIEEIFKINSDDFDNFFKKELEKFVSTNAN